MQQIDRLDLIKQQLNGHVELFLGAINDIYTYTGAQLDMSGQPLNGVPNQPVCVQALAARIIESNNQLLATVQAPTNTNERDGQEIDFMEMTEVQMRESLYQLQEENEKSI